MPELSPTQTSYAVLGLLALRPWTAYELARQSERSLRWFFPRAERAVYLEAKRLVELGWARARKTTTGRRASNVYRITPAGERAMRAWLAAPSAPAQIESEGALKVFFADRSDAEKLRATIQGMRDQAAESLRQLAGMAAQESEFPERMRTNVLSMRLIADIHQALHRWAVWADGAVDVLENGTTAEAEQQTTEILRSIVRRGHHPPMGGVKS
jgi:DNA-binding PadR family transcriptional regulator